MLIIVVVLLVLIGLYVMKVYNNLVGLNEKANVNWSQVDVLLKQRADLIPNLVETIKGAGKYESETLEAVISARNKFVSAPTKEDEMKADGELSQVLNRLFALNESYPDLKVNQNYLDLQNELTNLEEKISKYRQFFNDSVYSYNRYLLVFPNSLIANLFHFTKQSYFEVDEASKESPKVKF